MNDQTLHNVLHDIAQQEIPDDMKTLWPAIQAQLPDQRHAHRLFWITRWGWVTAMLVLSLMVGAGAYAFTQFTGSNGDAGLAQIEDRQLVTEIGESQTIDDVTVTLDWAYLDTHRAALSLTILDTGAGENMPPSPGTSRLVDDQGRVYPPMFGGGGSSGELAMANVNFDASVIEDTPETVTFSFELFVQRTAFEPPSPPADGEQPTFGGGSGGGGGNGEGSGGGAGGMMPSGDQIGPFVFEFTVPFIPATVIEPDLSATANGITLTLEQVAVAPSMTRALVCGDVPPESASLLAHGDLDTGSQVIADQLGAQPAQSESGVCYELSILVPWDRQPADWTLTVTHLARMQAYTLEELQAAFAEYGVTIAIHEDGSWESVDVPPDVDPEAIREAVLDRFTEQIDGPWVFAFGVPQHQCTWLGRRLEIDSGPPATDEQGQEATVINGPALDCPD